MKLIGFTIKRHCQLNPIKSHRAHSISGAAHLLIGVKCSLPSQAIVLVFQPMMSIKVGFFSTINSLQQNRLTIPLRPNILRFVIAISMGEANRQQGFNMGKLGSTKFTISSGQIVFQVLG